MEAQSTLTIALIISGIISLLIFRTNYNSNISISRKRYSKPNDKSFDTPNLILDIITAVLFALVGTYLSWHSISTIDDFKIYVQYQLLISLMGGVLFQHLLPILVEVALERVVSLKDKIK